MRRVNSVQVPGITRKMLRERLPRFLPTHEASESHSDLTVTPSVTDQELVDLILNLEFLPSSDIAQARALFEQGSGAEESAPTLAMESPSDEALQVLEAPSSFDELIKHGWVQLSWGRISIPQELKQANRYGLQITDTRFKRLMKNHHQAVIKLKPGFKPSRRLKGIANKIIAGDLRIRDISCISSAWVTAQLWTHMQSIESLNPEERLSEWMDKWKLLGFPSFALSRYISQESFATFVETSLRVLKEDGNTPNWEQFEEILHATLKIFNQTRMKRADTSTALVSCMRWISSDYQVYAARPLMDSPVSDVFGALLNQITNAEFASAELCAELMQLASNKPTLLFNLAWRARNRPVLLADMLMHPKTCSLACYFIATWEWNANGWNQEFQIPATQATITFAFEDALALLGGHIDADSIPAHEIAALMSNVFSLTSNQHNAPWQMKLWTLLKEEIASAPTGLQDEIFNELVVIAKTEAHTMAAASAALELVHENSSVERVAPDEITEWYKNTLFDEGERVGIKHLDNKACQTLVALVLRSQSSSKEWFLNAIDVKAWKANAPTNPNKEGSYEQTLVRRIRLHIRVLARAIAQWPTDVPKELVDTLCSTVYAGAIHRPDEHRIDAFVPNPGFGLTNDKEPSIALDLALALRKLVEPARNHLIDIICEIKEPIVLAEIFVNTPSDIQSQIKSSIQKLTPEEAPEVWSLPSLQARIDALLSAGFTDVAELFITEERNAKTWGPTRGRDITTLRTQLRLKFAREDWDGIASHQISTDVKQTEHQECFDTLKFFQGIAEIKRPNGSFQKAEAIFKDLARRHPDVIAYRANLFASKVSLLLTTDIFRQLSDEQLASAKRYLKEAEENLLPLIQHSPNELKSINVNRAFLYLAAGMTKEGHQLLLEMAEATSDEVIDGVRALSIARLGQKDEALSMLSSLERTLGKTELLSAIRDNIENDHPYAGQPRLSVSDDPVPGLRIALATFSRLDVRQQAKAWHPSGRLDLFVTEEIRQSCASLVSLAPMMKTLGLINKEDDVSSVLQHILQSRLHFVQWAVLDQSRGGPTKSGGIGRRDLVIKKENTELAVIEALIVDSVEKGNLTSHFEKLFWYANCQFFFHITYVRKGSCNKILNHLKEIAATSSSGIKYIRHFDLEDTGSRPLGFQVMYELDSRPIVMIFLVLGFAQAPKE